MVGAKRDGIRGLMSSIRARSNFDVVCDGDDEDGEEDGNHTFDGFLEWDLCRCVVMVDRGREYEKIWIMTMENYNFSSFSFLFS